MTGPALTGTAANLFSLETSQDSLVFSQGVDNIMALALTGTVYAAINANAKPSRSLTRWNNRLYAGFTVEGGTNAPFRVRWSGFGDHTDWVGISAGFLDLADNVYQVRAIRKLMNNLIVYTEKGIFVGVKTGSVAGPAQFDLVVTDIGLLSPFLIQGHNTVQFIVGTDNFYLFNGAQLQAVGGAVRAQLFRTYNPAAVLRNFSYLNLDAQEFVAYINMQSEVVPGTAWVYQWERGVMYPWRFASPVLTCSATHYRDSDVTIAQLVGTIAQQTFTFASLLSTNSASVNLFGGSDGNIYTMDSAYPYDSVGSTKVPIACRWTSQDFTASDIDPSLANRMVEMHGVGFTYLDPGTPFTLAFYFSVDRGTSWSGPFNKTVGGTAASAIGDAYLSRQTTGRRVRFKIENNSDTEVPFVIAFYPELEAKAQAIQ